MNIIYKVIWHASLGIWIAVSELAKGRTKSQNNTLLSAVQSVNPLTGIPTPTCYFKYHALLQAILLISAYSVSTLQYAGVSLGVGGNGSGANALAIGSSTTYPTFASGTYSIAIGVDAYAANTNSVAIGTSASATRDDALALGSLSNASAVKAIAFGFAAKSSGINSVAFGTGAHAIDSHAIALGVTSQATLANAVALGALSTTASNATNIAAFTQNGLTFSNFAGKVSDVGRQVSVGYAGYERQIKHVGSGDISAASTDAVNGSQLFATNTVLGNSANSQKTLLGGNAALSSDGRVSMSNIGGTGKNTIDEAIAAAMQSGGAGTANKTVAGSNITVTPTLEADGSTTYQIATTSDLKGLTRVETVDGSKTSIMTAASTTVTDGNEISMLSAKGTNVTDGTNSSQYGANGLSINGSDVVLNSTGLNVGGVTLSSTGINANAQKITNLADGQIAASSKDAINGGQLFTALQTSTTGTQTAVNTLATDIAQSLGGNAAYDSATGGWTAPGYTVTTNPATATTTQVNNVGDALTALDSAVNKPLTFSGDSGSSVNPLGSALAINGDANLTTVVSQGKAKLKLNTDLKDLTRVETVDGSKTSIMTAASTTVTDGNEISMLSAKGTNVTDGTNSSQYGANGLSINGSDVVLNSTGLNVGGVTLSSTGINANAQKITNLADGQIAASSKDAINGGQIYTVKTDLETAIQNAGTASQGKLDGLAGNLAQALGGNAAYDSATGGWTAPGYTVTTNPATATTTQVNNVGDALTALDSAVNKPLTFSGDSGSSVNPLGSALAINGDANLTTVVSQGKAELKLNTDLKGLTRVETVDGSKTSIMTAASTTVTDGNEISMLSAKGTNVTDGSNSSLYGANGLSINGSDVVLNSTGLNVGGLRISKTGIDANGQIIAQVANGKLDNDAVNVGQLNKAIDSLNNNHQADAVQIDQAIQNIAKSLGGNAAYDIAKGVWTAPGYTVTTNPATAATTQVNNVGDALTALDSAVNKPLTFSGDSGSSVNPLGSALAINGDANLTTVVSQGKAELKLNTDLKGLTRVETVDGSKTSIMTAASTTVTDGNEISMLSAKGTNVTDGTNSSQYGANGLSINGSDVVLNSTGLNVGGVTLSSTGINANAQKITNLADGLLDSDATSLGQVKSLISNTSSSLTGLGFSLQADDLQTVNKKLGEAIAVTGDSQNIVTKINNDKLSIQLADQLNVVSINAGGSLLNAAGLTVGNTSVNSGGIFIVGGPSLSSSGINAGNKVISHVATGVSDTDAVNKGQLDSAISNLKDNVSQVSAGAVQYDKNADGSINKNTISLAGGSNGTLISNVADGQIATGSKDAVNGGQLAAVQDNLQTQITQNTQNISQIQNQFNTGAIGLVKQTDAHADITVAQQTGGTRVNVAGTDGHRVVTGVKDGNVATGSSDAVTGNQLYANYEHMAAGLGGGAAYDNNTWTAPSYTVGEGDNRTTVHDVGSALEALNRTDSALNARIDTLGTQLENSFRATNQRIDKIEKHTNAGIAAALAIEAPAYVAGKFTYAVGAAAYRGESAAGISLRRTAEKGNWSMTAGVAADSQGTPAFRIGIGGVID